MTEWAGRWRVALRIALNGDEGIEVDCLAVGGLSLMERMLGYRRVILVDSIETGAPPLGDGQRDSS